MSTTRWDWRRITKGDPRRRTRFHTTRGDRIPLAAWRDVPKSVLRRLRNAPLSEPWIAPDAVRWLADRVTPNWQVLELGSGASTPWFARRVGSMLTLEDNESWASATRDSLARLGIANCEVRTAALESFESILQGLNASSFDLVLIDCNESPHLTRIDCLVAAHQLVKPGGHVVLDDSDRPEYRDADRILSGWRASRFVGVRQFPLAATETTIYQRP